MEKNINSTEFGSSGGMVINANDDSLTAVKEHSNYIVERVKSTAEKVGIQIAFSTKTKIVKEKKLSGNRKFVKYENKVNVQFMDDKFNSEKLELEDQYNNGNSSVIDFVKGKIRGCVQKDIKSVTDPSSLSKPACMCVRG